MEWGPDNVREQKVTGPSWIYYLVIEGKDGFEKHTQEELVDWNGV